MSAILLKNIKNTLFFCFVFAGELLGMEYLYSQTGKALTPVLQNPVEEARLVEEINDDDIQDEGFEEETVVEMNEYIRHENGLGVKKVRRILSL